MNVSEINFGTSAGETVTETGLYRVFHDANHATVKDVVCLKGETLPQCVQCGSKVKFVLQKRLIHASQYARLVWPPEVRPKT